MSKNWDINLLNSEKKSLLSFLSLYFIFTLILIFILSFLYYSFQKDLMLQEKRIELSNLANEQITKLKRLHVNFENDKIYPRDERFQSAIFDSAKKEIFSTFGSQKVDLDRVVYLEDGNIYFIKEPESYYLGTKYLVMQMQAPTLWESKTYKNIVIFGVGFFIVMMVLGYFLSKLFLKPMRDAIELLDRFIKDTTHELNTPVNAILSNIEMIDKTSLDEKLAKKINRIEIGARTVSNLYQDLTYLTLSHKIISEDEDVSLEELVRERIEYFSLFANSRKIEMHLEVDAKPTLHVDRKKLAKLVDNILSNAIKYNKISGKIFITLKNSELVIKDTGRGIAKEKLQEIFTRYKRVDESVGGFGIGLSIVVMIAKEYNLKIEIDSQQEQWTEVKIIWES